MPTPIQDIDWHDLIDIRTYEFVNNPQATNFEPFWERIYLDYDEGLQEFYIYTGLTNAATTYAVSNQPTDNPYVAPVPACPAAVGPRVVDFITIATDALD